VWSTTRKAASIFAAVTAVVAISRGALAENGRVSVVVWAEGTDKDAIRTQAIAGLADFSVVDPGDWQFALGQQGLRSTLALREPKRKKHALEQVRAAAHAVHADGVVVLIGAKGHETTMIVVETDANDMPAETKVTAGRNGEELAHTVQGVVAMFHPGAGGDSAAAPVGSPAAAGAPAGSSDSASTSGESRPTRDSVAGTHGPLHQVGRNLFELSVGVEGGMRRFDYTDGLTPNLRPYKLNAAPLVDASGEIYPLAGAHAIDVGAVLGYARAFALQSSTTESGNVSTQWSRYSLGARVRVRTGSESSPVIGLMGAYGDEAFTISSSSPTAFMPSVDYHFVRASGDLRVPFGRFAAFADVGYLFVLSSGDVAGRFPKASVGGVEAELGGAFAIGGGFEARATASYRRFFYSMNPTPGDNFVAGGALDQLAGLQGSIAYVY
jgi:hypothetical protein